MDVKYGSNRLVLIFDYFVIKIPIFWRWRHFLQGLLSNINENDTWRYNSGKYENSKTKYLCPVIFCFFGGWFLLMKKAKPLNRFQLESYKDRIEIIRYFGGDDNEDNFGEYKYRIVKIDYGSLNNN